MPPPEVRAYAQAIESLNAPDPAAARQQSWAAVKWGVDNVYGELGTCFATVKNAIFADNAARLYGLELDLTLADLSSDQISAIRQDCLALNEGRSNLRYGYVTKAKEAWA